MRKPSARGVGVVAGRVTRAVGGATKPVGRAVQSVVGPVAQGVGGWVAVLTLLATAVMFAIGWPTMHFSNEVTPSLQPLMAVLEVAPILLLARSPFLGWALSTAGALVWWLLTPSVAGAPMPWPVVHFLILLATIVVAAMFAQLREVAIVVVVSAALFAVAMPPELKAWAFGQALFVVFGLLVRWLVISRRQLAKASEETETERARRAVVEERSRIARELHDVVAHHMSMMVVQAQSAPVRLDGMSPQVRDEFASIERSARQALNEVRGVLGVLREEEGGRELAPQPGTDDLTDLLESARAAGVDISWQVDLGDAEVGPGAGLVLHRILQEALANASRHAPGAPVEVTIRLDGDAVELVVGNGAPARGALEAWPDESGGHGIPGMHTRAEAVGGHVETGPTGDGGFVVRVRIPLSAADL